VTGDVQPGQVWADNRSAGRTLRIDSTAHGNATCIVVSNSDEVQAYCDQYWGHFHPGVPAPAGKAYGDKRGTTTRIAIARFDGRSFTSLPDTV
jgi:hypothetical protein